MIYGRVLVLVVARLLLQSERERERGLQVYSRRPLEGGKLSSGSILLSDAAAAATNPGGQIPTDGPSIVYSPLSTSYMYIHTRYFFLLYFSSKKTFSVRRPSIRFRETSSVQEANSMTNILSPMEIDEALIQKMSSFYFGPIYYRLDVSLLFFFFFFPEFPSKSVSSVCRVRNCRSQSPVDRILRSRPASISFPLLPSFSSFQVDGDVGHESMPRTRMPNHYLIPLMISKSAAFRYAGLFPFSFIFLVRRAFVHRDPPQRKNSNKM